MKIELVHPTRWVVADEPKDDTGSRSLFETASLRVPLSGLTRLRVRGLERVALHADLTMLARLSQSRSRARGLLRSRFKQEPGPAIQTPFALKLLALRAVRALVGCGLWAGPECRASQDTLARLERASG